MSSNSNIDREGIKDYSYRTSNIHDYYLPQRIGHGSLPNYRVRMCKTCGQNGYHHEAVVARATKILNYNDGTEHVHRKVLDDPEIWAALWSSREENDY